FDKKLNVIIGANGQLKTSLMDAIRLFYAWGEPNRDIEITKEDFHADILHTRLNIFFGPEKSLKFLIITTMS
ncbi:MAG: hypothetical protein IJ005_07370, partial [Bacteroidales bacterium]|nr:hypothetical protein [Bacteroidales bacterium]